MSVFALQVAFAGPIGSGGGGGGTDPTPVDPLTVTLTSPDDQATIAVNNPTFVVGVDTSLESPLAAYTLHLQYADNQAMTGATELTSTFTAVEAGAFISSTSVPATTWWRARVAQDSTWRSAWTDAQSFTVSSAVVSSDAAIIWAVDSTNAGRPAHLWYILPPAASPGDKVTIYGEGFPNSGGKVLLGGTPCTVNAWNLVTQVGNPDDTRHIDSEDVYPEHYEVVITVPNYDPPGGPMEVTS